jgi:hypothetical protein
MLVTCQVAQAKVEEGPQFASQACLPLPQSWWECAAGSGAVHLMSLSNKDVMCAQFSKESSSLPNSLEICVHELA